jgi:hypothetical protein
MKEKTQLTAVEWVLDWMSKNQYFIGNDLLKAVEQAKVMEKEQHKKTYFKGWHSIGNRDEDFEQYYNETFKQQEQ